MINEKFVIVVVIIEFLGGLSYLIDTLKGKVKPNRVTFFLWSLSPAIAFAAQIKQGVGIQSLMTFVTGFVPFTIFLASFINKKSYWKIKKFDLACGAISIIGLILWQITGVGNIAILFSIFSEIFAVLPTLTKSYYYPDTESAYPYLTSSTNAGLTILTIKNWIFAQYAFPFYIFLINLIIFILVKFRIGKKLIFVKN